MANFSGTSSPVADRLQAIEAGLQVQRVCGTASLAAVIRELRYMNKMSNEAKRCFPPAEQGEPQGPAEDGLASELTEPESEYEHRQPTGCPLRSTGCRRLRATLAAACSGGCAYSGRLGGPTKAESPTQPQAIPQARPQARPQEPEGAPK